MSMMSWIGEKIDIIQKKAMEEENNIKSFLLAFVGGFVDGTMITWAIAGVLIEIVIPICWLINKLRNKKN